jgi:hydrogenase maturation protease
VDAGAASRSALVLGVGNPLMTDDGVGLKVMEGLRRSCAFDDVEFLDAGTLSLVLLPRIERCRRLLVLDAARLGAPPGTVRVLENVDMDAFLRESGSTVHDVGLRDLLDAARLTGALPTPRALVGVQPELVGWGTHCSPAVEAAIPEALAYARALLERWLARART